MNLRRKFFFLNFYLVINHGLNMKKNFIHHGLVLGQCSPCCKVFPLNLKKISICLIIIKLHCVKMNLRRKFFFLNFYLVINHGLNMKKNFIHHGLVLGQCSPCCNVAHTYFDPPFVHFRFPSQTSLRQC